MRILKISVLLSLLAIAGCTKSQPTGAHADACALMPKNSAEKIFGTELSDPKSQGFGDNPRLAVVSNCLYVAKSNGDLKSLTFTIRTGNVDATQINPAELHIMTMKQEFGQRYEMKKLEVLGNGAVWDDSLKQLTVFKGTNTYVWTAPGAAVPDLEQKMITLAKHVLS